MKGIRMAKRGPKPKVARKFGNPSEPPNVLTDYQKAIWRKIVNGLPVDWFSHENYPLLIQYCRHVDRSHHISQMIEDMTSKEFIVKDYRDLLRSEDEQSKIISSLATKMRLTQQSAYDKSKVKERTGRLDDPNAPYNFGKSLEELSEENGTPLEELINLFGPQYLEKNMNIEGEDH